MDLQQQHAARQAQRAAEAAERAFRRAHYRDIIHREALGYLGDGTWSMAKRYGPDWKKTLKLYLSAGHAILFMGRAVPTRWALRDEVVDIVVRLDDETFEPTFYKVVEREGVPRVGPGAHPASGGGEHPPAASTGPEYSITPIEGPTQERGDER